MGDVNTAKRLRRISTVFGFSLPLFYLFWLVFVGTFAFHELLLGIMGAVLAGVGFSVIDFYYPARFSPKLREIVSLWPVPWYFVLGTWQITAVAAKDLFGIEKAKSVFRILKFNTGKKDNPHDDARRVLAVVAMTVTPNTIVLGANTNDQALLFHEMGRSSPPKMLRKLGARA
jgi:multisubunit Na+/H+ antiporter MnhE subunit